MHKIFLSHSSMDKPYVSQIAKLFGRDRCVYDNMCFEAGMQSLDEIYREMDRSSIFVLFISDAALNSDWVQMELALADQKLNYDKQKISQIFPIIIDSQITHRDPRIPSFLREGFGAYNLRVITNSIIAYRKIKAQQVRYLMNYHLISSDSQDCFYGRDGEITSFKKAFDTGRPINCVIASGLTGIGRKSYLLKCLRDSEIIEKYYTPPIISLDSMSSIEDLLVKLSEIGFGDYSLETVTTLPDITSKIAALEVILRCIQSYQEQVIVYDDGCLIDRTGCIVYWLQKVLQSVTPQITLIIAASNKVKYNNLSNNPTVFSTDLSTLTYPEWSGLMRVYGKSLNLDIPSSDREYFKDIITGYPPQVRYCVELMKSTSIEEVKRNPHIIVDHFSPKITAMLEAAIPKEIRDDAYGLLAFASSYGIVPTDLFLAVLDIKSSYKDIFSRFLTLTICRYLGISNEYVEVNPVIADFIQRSHFNLPNDIQSMLEKRLKKFNDSIDIADKTKTEDFENIKYYLKTNIIAGKNIPPRFMYSTLYLSSIYDLYNLQKYPQVISIVKKLKDTGSFARYDQPIQARIQGYYCRALARAGDDSFYHEVEFFKLSDINEYNFLRGFMFRLESKYDQALDRYSRVLSNQPQHRSTMREIVAVYRGLEDYETAYEYAKANYIREPENPYQIQPFFEILIRKSGRSREENSYIQDMLNAMHRINSTKPTSTYFEILGQYAAYVEKNREQSLAILREGITMFPESSFVVRSMFDCAEVFHAKSEMKDALDRLNSMSNNSKAIKSAFHIRTALYYAYENKPSAYIYHYVDTIDGLNDEAKRRLKGRIDYIISCATN